MSELKNKFEALDRIAAILLEIDKLTEEKAEPEKTAEARTKLEAQWVQMGYSYEQMCGR